MCVRSSSLRANNVGAFPLSVALGPLGKYTQAHTQTTFPASATPIIAAGATEKDLWPGATHSFAHKSSLEWPANPFAAETETLRVQWAN